METKYTYDDKGRIILEIDLDAKNNLIKETRYKYEEKNGYKYIYKRVISKYNIEDSYFQIYKYYDDDNDNLVSCIIKDVYNRKVYEFKNSTIIINDYYDNTVTTAVLDKYKLKILNLIKYKIIDNKQYTLITFTSEKNGVFKFIEYDELNRINCIRIFNNCNYLMSINKIMLENFNKHINNTILVLVNTNLAEDDFIKIVYTYEKNTNKIKKEKIYLPIDDCNTVFEYNDEKMTTFKANLRDYILIGTIDMNINNTNSIYSINRLECDISIIESVESYNLHLVYENDILVEIYDNNVKYKNDYKNKINSLFSIPEIQYFSKLKNALEYCDNNNIIISLLDRMQSFIRKEYDTYGEARNDYISFTEDNYTFKSSGNVLSIYKTYIDNDIKTIEVFKVLFDIRNFDIRKFDKDSIESYIKNIIKEEKILSNYILKYKLLHNNKQILINREELK